MLEGRRRDVFNNTATVPVSLYVDHLMVSYTAVPPRALMTTDSDAEQPLQHNSIRRNVAPNQHENSTLNENDD